ncbi:MAG TPA: NAD(P)/FAD-dependent oxidoreductase, partial [Leptospiraceae bacterium]|nr:NAD(P)/FAD-dependent oxidoreductase [Leptospiraceae bacterium]
MKKILILGAGISGNTAAMYAKAGGGKDIEVTVVSPGSRWNWIPSNIWVGVGLMKPEQVTFELEPVYRKAGIIFKQAKALSIHPEGSETAANPFVRIEYTSPSNQGVIEDVEYDFLINATG